jgi:hypothetical protein
MDQKSQKRDETALGADKEALYPLEIIFGF